MRGQDCPVAHSREQAGKEEEAGNASERTVEERASNAVMGRRSGDGGAGRWWIAQPDEGREEGRQAGRKGGPGGVRKGKRSDEGGGGGGDCEGNGRGEGVSGPVKRASEDYGCAKRWGGGRRKAKHLLHSPHR